MGFFTSDRMTPEEIDKALHYMSALYAAGAKKYGSRFFNYNEFRHRYLLALKNKNTMSVFFKVEKESFLAQEEKTKRYLAILNGETKEDKKESALDLTIKNIIAQTDGYPEFYLGERENVEVSRLIGVCKFLYSELTKLSIYVPVEKSTVYHHACKSLSDVVNEPYGFTLKSYISAMENEFLPSSQLDAIGQKLIKEIGMGLQTILTVLRDTDPIQAGHMVEYLDKVIIDFRLDIFKGMG